MKIMIVDDNSEMRRMLRAVIAMGSAKNIEIIECSDGVEAVDRFSESHPDIVLMDIQLKAMNGFQAAERIWSQEPRAKVIFVTSHDTPLFRNKAEQLRATGFVSKAHLSELDSILQSLSS